ncbi:MAG: DNA polymerase IV [Patescibacteria group bacterium]
MTKPSKPYILHLDGDAFFVGCEMALDPTLKGKIVVTGQERGIVSALSYEAKAAGVTRGMPISQLKRMLPQAIVKPGNYRAYASFARQMFEIVRRFTPTVEEYSIDECFADLTGTEKANRMTVEEIAVTIQQTILSELDISVSVGLAPSKCLAKVASKWAKPYGMTVIYPDDYMTYLEKTPIEKLWGIGSRMGKRFKSQGIVTAAAFAGMSEEWVHNSLAKPYRMMWYELHGFSLLPVSTATKDSYKSIGVSRTFHPNCSNVDELISYLSRNIEHACVKARRYQLLATHVSFFLKTKDFDYVGAELTLPYPTHVPGEIMGVIEPKLRKLFNRYQYYRTTGITLTGLVSEGREQLDVFGLHTIRTQKSQAFMAVDKIAAKYGTHSVFLASGMGARAKARQDEGVNFDKKKGGREDQVDMHVPFLSIL